MNDRHTFQTTIEQQIQQWNALMNEYSIKIRELKTKAEKLEVEAKLQHLEQIKELEHRIEAVQTRIANGQQKLDTIRSAGDEAWEEVKIGSEKAWDELVQGMTTAWEEVKTSLEQASLKIQDHAPKK